MCEVWGLISGLGIFEDMLMTVYVDGRPCRICDLWGDGLQRFTHARDSEAEFRVARWMACIEPMVPLR